MNGYVVFQEIYRTGQISRAARRLHVTQPAVSHALRALEEELGVALFHRTPKGMVATPHGEALIGHVDRALQLLAQGVDAVKNKEGLVAGELRIGASDSVMRFYLMDRLKAFREVYPSLTLKVVNRTSDQIARLVQQGEVDLGFVHLTAEGVSAASAVNHRNYVGLKVVTVSALQEILVFAPKAWDHQRLDAKTLASKTLSREDILALPMIVLEEGTSMRSFFNQCFSPPSDWWPALECNSAEAALAFAERGFGIAFVTKEFSKEALRSGAVKALETQKPIPARSIGLLMRQDSPLLKPAEVFLNQFLMDEDERHTP